MRRHRLLLGVARFEFIEQKTYYYITFTYYRRGRHISIVVVFHQYSLYGRIRKPLMKSDIPFVVNAYAGSEAIPPIFAIPLSDSLTAY